MTTVRSLGPHRFTQATAGVRIVVVDGQDRGAQCCVGADPMRIGSARDADLVLGDPSISRYHADVRWQRDALVVLDRSSKNGTFVGGCRIREVEVPVGTTLRLGTTTLKVIPDAEAI